MAQGNLVHKKAHETIVTKTELRELCDSREDLVHRMATFGAEIPTTSMHWKHHGRDLEWIVRQMSWKPPWTDAEPETFLEQHPQCHPARSKLPKNPVKMEPGQSDVADAQSSVKQEATEADAQKEPLHTNDRDCSVSSENESEDDDEFMTG